MKPKTVTYYVPCAGTDLEAVMLNGMPYKAVTAPTTDRYLLDAVRLARRVAGGLPWHDAAAQRYGIAQSS